MELASKKRTLDSFFAPSTKKTRTCKDSSSNASNQSYPPTLESLIPSGRSGHFTYPFPIQHLPPSASSGLSSLPSTVGKAINDQADLDLLYFQPYMPKNLARELFEFLRGQLPFYRVEYKIKRVGIETQVKTPRYTTVFGVDHTSRFNEAGQVVDARTRAEIQRDKQYVKYAPRPIPKCLDDLRLCTEAATGCDFNFCLVNYYASGSDSISYHSDDEHFLGELPTVASFSLGAKRDFLMKHKPRPKDDDGLKPPETTLVKIPLGSGDMVLMRGRTQTNWLHSIPKRSGKGVDGGRINITFRKVIMRAGTENYYNYNVGTGPVFKWDGTTKEMKLWNPKP